MKRILVVSGSRADAGMLEWPLGVLRDSFDTMAVSIAGGSVAGAYESASEAIRQCTPDCIVILGDRYEILAAAIAAHLNRIKIAHLCGGDVTQGSYDDAMRDCISRLAWIHFPTSIESANRLWSMGLSNVRMVGSTGVDYILNADWRKERPIKEPYVLVAYYPETIDGTVEWNKVLEAIDGRRAIVIAPNPDRGAKALHLQMVSDTKAYPNISVWATQPHDDFLNLLTHCDEFIGNSSAIYYEAPFLGVACREIGKRQKGRVKPFGDGKASERIRDILLEKL